MTLIIQKPTGAITAIKKPTAAKWNVTGKSDIAMEGFNSLTFSGPFLLPRGGWTIGTPGTTGFGVGSKAVGVDEPVHTASGSMM